MLAGAERLSAAQPLDQGPLSDILPAKILPPVPAPAVRLDAPHVLHGHLELRRLRHLHPLLPGELNVSGGLHAVFKLYSTAPPNLPLYRKQTPRFSVLQHVQAIPVVTVWVGVFPLAISRKLTLAVTLYITAILALLFRVRTTKHLKCLFYAGKALTSEKYGPVLMRRMMHAMENRNIHLSSSISAELEEVGCSAPGCCNQILWWCFVKAAWRAWVTTVFGGSIVFKATAKGDCTEKEPNLTPLCC